MSTARRAMAKRKTFEVGETVKARITDGPFHVWIDAVYVNAVGMPGLWLGPGLHIVRLADGSTKSLTAARVRAARAKEQP